MTHITKEYAGGIGHIEQRGDNYLVTFYGRWVAQVFKPTLESARFALRRLAA